MNNLTTLTSWIARHIFVIATGFAALLHSTWTLATVFNGPEPHQFTGDWLAWVIPAFVFAFSIDAGQIATSVEIRNGERTRTKYATFAVLAVSTYFLQWWYIAHHLPNFKLALGVRPEWDWFATLLSDAAIWIVPGMLPLTTILYTFSYAKPKQVRAASTVTKAVMQPIATSKETAIVPVPEPASNVKIEMPDKYEAKCDLCDWTKSYPTPRGAINAVVAHKRHNHSDVAISTNGRH